MTRLVIDPEEDGVSTRELRDEEIAEETLRFDDAGRSQDLEDHVADAFADAYDSLHPEEEVDPDSLDDIGQLLAGTVDDVGTVIESGEFDDRLDEVEQREREGDERSTVLNTIERRREVIESVSDEEEDADADADDESAGDETTIEAEPKSADPDEVSVENLDLGENDRDA